MLHELRQIRDRLQPKSTNNLDALQFNYLFWSDVEKIAKKERGLALDNIKIASKTPTSPGVVLRGLLYKTTLKQTNPRRTFDKDLFIDLLCDAYPEIPRHTLREIATKAVEDGSVSNTYTVVGASEEDD